jgi:hypothetical protein
MIAATMALALLTQNGAWAATCLDGSTFPNGGFIVGSANLPGSPGNWTENVFTGTTGSIFVPDTSVNEDNDPNKPLTGGGHNWAFDQGSSLCRLGDSGAGGAPATGWILPPSDASSCVGLLIIKNGLVVNIGDVPGYGSVLTPTCDPTKLSTAAGPNPANTYLNQLGCAISYFDHNGVITANTPQTATSFLFTAGIKSGMFQIPLKNSLTAQTPGKPAGKFAAGQNYYSAGRNNGAEVGDMLTNAQISPDGLWLIGSSPRRSIQHIWACMLPLGDPGDPSLPPNFAAVVPYTQTGQVKCMVVGQHGLSNQLTTAFGPDYQPYFGGQRVVNAFNGNPGGSFAPAWPQCIYQGMGGIPFLNPVNQQQMLANAAVAFNNNSQNHCGNALPVSSLGSGAQVTQPSASAVHGSYLYLAPIGGIVVQAKITGGPWAPGVTPAGTPFPYTLTQFPSVQTYVTGTSLVTGLGAAEDLKSLMVMADPSGIGLAAQEVLTKVPLCEP